MSILKIVAEEALILPITMLQKSLNTALHSFNRKLPFLSVGWVLHLKMMSTVNFSYQKIYIYES